mgnify:CR=1 FL=1
MSLLRGLRLAFGLGFEGLISPALVLQETGLFGALSIRFYLAKGLGFQSERLLGLLFEPGGFVAALFFGAGAFHLCIARVLRGRRFGCVGCSLGLAFGLVPGICDAALMFGPFSCARSGIDLFALLHAVIFCSFFRVPTAPGQSRIAAFERGDLRFNRRLVTPVGRFTVVALRCRAVGQGLYLQRQIAPGLGAQTAPRDNARLRPALPSRSGIVLGRVRYI